MKRIGPIAEVFIELTRLLLIILFAYTAFSKVLDYKKLFQHLHDSPLLPAFFSYLAWLVPLVEFIVVVLLIIPRTLRCGLLWSSVLMFLFTLYVLAILTVADYVPCSCGGVIELLSWRGHLLFNGCFLALSFIALFLQARRSIRGDDPLSELR